MESLGLSIAELKKYDLYVPPKIQRKPRIPPPCFKVNVYKIWWEHDPETTYVGITGQTLSQRMSCHRSMARQGINTKVYQHMREHGIDCFKYVLLESSMVSCHDEKAKLEQEWIDKLKPTLNMMNAWTSPEDRKQNELQTKKEYKDNLKWKIFRCVCCDMNISMKGKAKHLKTKKHIEAHAGYMAGLYSMAEME